MNTFFRQAENTGTNFQKLDKEDFFRGNTNAPIRITVAFGNLSADAQERFKDYARNGTLVTTAMAIFNDSTEQAEVKHFGQRPGLTAFMPYFAAYSDDALSGPLKTIYNGLRAQFPSSPRHPRKMGDVILAYELRIDEPWAHVKVDMNSLIVSRSL